MAELWDGSMREDCICTRPQVNRYEKTLDYPSPRRVSETISTPPFWHNIHRSPEKENPLNRTTLRPNS